MKQAIMEAVNNDTEKYELIMQKTQNQEVTRMRRGVFVALKMKGYKAKDIAAYFHTTKASVLKGANILVRNGITDTFEPISETIIKKLPSYIRYNKSAVYNELNKMGYSKTAISLYFGVHSSTVGKSIKTYLEEKECEKRKRNIIKFR